MNKSRINLYKKLRGQNFNGYTVNAYSLIYGLSHGDEYPKMQKMVDQPDGSIKVYSISYFKYYDKRGEYYFESYTIPTEEAKKYRSGELICYCQQNRKEVKLEDNNRFNVNKIINYCNTFIY